jgi:hypothetical protein
VDLGAGGVDGPRIAGSLCPLRAASRGWWGVSACGTRRWNGYSLHPNADALARSRLLWSRPGRESPCCILDPEVPVSLRTLSPQRAVSSAAPFVLALLPIVLLGCQPKFEGDTGDGADADTDTDTDTDTDADADADADADTDLVGTIIINEFMPSNQSGVQDEAGAYPDWIELYNPGTSDVSLEGWTITDDLEKPDRHELDASLTVPAGGFLLLFADDDEEDGANHLNFDLTAEGENIGIFDDAARPSDQLEYGAMAGDLSAARMPDGSSNWEITDQDTPGSSNGAEP